FDDVMNDQRKVIYEQRADIMDAESVSDVIADMRAETVQSIVAVNCPEGTYPEQWNVEDLKESVDAIFGLQPPIDAWLQEEAVEPELIVERLRTLADEEMAKKSADLDPESLKSVEKQILLQTLDHHWKEHLATLVALREEVTRVLMRAQFRLEETPPELPDFITKHLDPFSADDDTSDIDAGARGLMTGVPPLMNIPQ